MLRAISEQDFINILNMGNQCQKCILGADYCDECEYRVSLLDFSPALTYDQIENAFIADYFVEDKSYEIGARDAVELIKQSFKAMMEVEE